MAGGLEIDSKGHEKYPNASPGGIAHVGNSCEQNGYSAWQPINHTNITIFDIPDPDGRDIVFTTNGLLTLGHGIFAVLQ